MHKVFTKKLPGLSRLSRLFIAMFVAIPVLFAAMAATVPTTASADKLCHVAPASYESTLINGATMGIWRVGTGCANNGSGTTGTTCTTIVASGNAACARIQDNPNAWGVTHVASSDADARLCFCKMTSPRSDGVWVLASVYFSSANCADNCALNCASSVGFFSDFRAAVLATP